MTQAASTLPARTFGIELEVILPANLDREGLAAVIRAAGVPCTAPGYSHHAARAWRVLTDGSLPYNGAEVVSPILRGEAGIARARTVAQAIEAAGCTVNVNCGFHVHVGAEDFAPRDITRTALTFMHFETFFDQIMPPSRRGSQNSYIGSNRARFGGYGTEALNAAFAALTAQPARDAYAAVEAAAGGQMNRYLKLNLTPFVGVDGRPAYNTVEFRQHSGTVEADKIEHWVRLCVAFVEKAKVARVRARTVTRDLTSAEEMGLFFSMFAIPTATRAFYAERRKALAAVDRKAARTEAARLAA